MYQWKDEYLVGVETIDAQHQLFFEKVNEFERLKTQGKSKELIEGMIDFLDSFAKQHFFDEEVYMKKHGFPDLEHQSLLHMQFTLKVESLKNRINIEPTDQLVDEVSAYVGDWLIHHVVELDHLFADYIGQNDQV